MRKRWRPEPPPPPTPLTLPPAGKVTAHIRRLDGVDCLNYKLHWYTAKGTPVLVVEFDPRSIAASSRGARRAVRNDVVAFNDNDVTVLENASSDGTRWHKTTGRTYMVSNVNGQVGNYQEYTTVTVSSNDVRGLLGL